MRIPRRTSVQVWGGKHLFAGLQADVDKLRSHGFKTKLVKDTNEFRTVWVYKFPYRRRREAAEILGWPANWETPGTGLARGLKISQTDSEGGWTIWWAAWPPEVCS